MSKILVIVKDLRDIEKIKGKFKSLIGDQHYKIVSYATQKEKDTLALEEEIHHIAEYAKAITQDHVSRVKKSLEILMKNIPRCKIGNITFREAFTFDGVCLWDAILRFLYERYFCLVVRYVDLIKSMI